MTEIKEQQLHILLGCADARDLSQAQVDAVNKTSREYRQKGIDVDFHVIRAAGSFVSPDVVMDIKRIIEHNQRNSPYIDKPVSYYVHIQSHGHLTEDSSKEYISHIYDLHIEDGSPLNCGMLGASSVGIEIEKLLLDEHLEVNIGDRILKVDSDEKLPILLRDVYAHNGYLAGDWIKSIDLLRTHPRLQRTVLQQAIEQDPDLKTLEIKITCGIQDYALHALIRVDGGDPAVPFWDDVQMLIRSMRSNERMLKEVLMRQTEKQKPLAGLICMSDPKMSSRTRAAQYYMDMKGIEHNGDYMPNTVFNISGSSFDMPFTPFGPYVIAGFYYAVKYLLLTDQIVMGYDDAQTKRMLKKIQNDPIMNLVVQKFGVNLIPLNNADVLPL